MTRAYACITTRKHGILPSEAESTSYHVTAWVHVRDPVL